MDQPVDLDLAREPIEQAAARAATIFVQIVRALEQRRVDPQTSREAVRKLFRGTLAEHGVGMLAALEEVATRVVPHSMGTPHPLYLGLVNSSPLPAAALGDLFVSALDNNGGAFHQSPAMTGCEEEVVRAFARLFGLSQKADGMILPGGTFANLQALVLARYRAFGDGPPPATARLYASEQAHFSVSRAAFVAGLGRSSVVAVPCRGRGEVDLDALADRLRADRRAGLRPFALVATIGTTGTGAIDPLRELVELTQRERLWLHVDACYGGAAMLVPELRRRLRSVAEADSIAVDPHKWFFAPLTAALLLTPHRALARRAFAVSGRSYLPGDGQADAWQRGIPTSRRSSGLTVWLGLRAHGWGAVRSAVVRNIALMRLLETLLAERGFTVLGGGELSIACARWEPNGRSAAELDRLQSALARELVASGRTWFSTVRFRRKTWLRFNAVNLHVREEHVRRLAEWLCQAADRKR